MEVDSDVDEEVPMEEDEVNHKCPVCQAKATFVCKACYTEHYCSPDHQKQHWRHHRLSCCNYRVLDVSKDTNLPGVWMDCTKYVVATRKLKPGEIILDEQPLLALPWIPAPVQMEHKWVICLTCGIGMEDPFIPQDVRRPNTYRCSTCSWPVCNEECEKNPLHADNECIIFTANKVCYPITECTWSEKLCDLYQNPGTLARAMSYRYKDPTFFNEIMKIPMWGGMKFPSNENPPQNRPPEPVAGPSHAVPAPTGKYPLASPDDDPKLWLDFKTLCQNVGFHLHATEDNVVETKNSVLQDTSHYRFAYNMYKTANTFSHSCSPNCDWMIGHGPDFKIRITAGVPIAKGEVLTINRMLYFTEGPPPGGLNRQEYFQRRFGFPCNCRICSDPTELGTYQLAVGCSTCRPFSRNVAPPQGENDGYYLPTDSTSLDDHAEWKCNLCGMVISKFRIQPQVNMIDQVLQITRWNTTRCPDGINTCRQILTHFRGWFFHPNHWLMIKAMQAIVLPKNTFKDFILAPIAELYEMRDGVELTILLWDKAVPCMSFEKANLIRTYLFTSEVINGTLSRENITELGYKTPPKSLETRRSTLISVRNSQAKCLKLYKRIRTYYNSAVPSHGANYCKFAVVINNLYTELKQHLSTNDKYIAKLMEEKPEEQPGTSKNLY